MALVQANFMSESLARRVKIQAVLPVDNYTWDGLAPYDNKPLCTLYLLHGIFGNCDDWLSESRIKRLAENKNLAVIMPSGDNSFYLDEPASGGMNNYGKFIGRDLVEMTRRMFPLSRNREDTFIGGLSMGGFGALRNGLKYHETFSHIAALSGAFHILEDISNTKNNIRRNTAYEESCFGNLKEAVSSDRNPKVIARELKAQAAHRTLKIYMACGTEDWLIEDNRAYRDFFRENGFDLTYCEEPGGHDWDFWDRHIEKALGWLP